MRWLTPQCGSGRSPSRSPGEVGARGVSLSGGVCATWQWRQPTLSVDPCRNARSRSAAAPRSYSGAVARTASTACWSERTSHTPSQQTATNGQSMTSISTELQCATGSMYLARWRSPSARVSARSSQTRPPSRSGERLHGRQKIVVIWLLMNRALEQRAPASSWTMYRRPRVAGHVQLSEVAAREASPEQRRQPRELVLIQIENLEDRCVPRRLDDPARQ